jgi:hypothetical protein
VTEEAGWLDHDLLTGGSNNGTSIARLRKMETSTTDPQGLRFQRISIFNLL